MRQVLKWSEVKYDPNDLHNFVNEKKSNFLNRLNTHSVRRTPNTHETKQNIKLKSNTHTHNVFVILSFICIKLVSPSANNCRQTIGVVAGDTTVGINHFK